VLVRYDMIPLSDLASFIGIGILLRDFSASGRGDRAFRGSGVGVEHGDVGAVAAKLSIRQSRQSSRLAIEMIVDQQKWPALLCLVSGLAGSRYFCGRSASQCSGQDHSGASGLSHSVPCV
jgi:hypothetical protein